MIKPHALPRSYTMKFNTLNKIMNDEISKLVHRIADIDGAKIDLKPLLLYTSANVFTRYFCSRSFDYEDVKNVVKHVVLSFLYALFVYLTN